MLVPQRVDRLGRVAREQVVRGHRGRGLVAAARVERDVLVETAPVVPGRTVRIELVVQEPGPGEIARPAVGTGVTGSDFDQLVQQPDGTDDHAAELRAVENATVSGVDAKRPRRVCCVAYAHVLRERVSGAHGCTEIPPLAGQLVEQEVAQAEQTHLVRLDASVEVSGRSGQTTTV